MTVNIPPLLRPEVIGGKYGNKIGRACSWPGCSHVTMSADPNEAEMHVRDKHMRDSRENYRSARRGLARAYEQGAVQRMVDAAATPPRGPDPAFLRRIGARRVI